MKEEQLVSQVEIQNYTDIQSEFLKCFLHSTGARHIERVRVDTPAEVRKAKKAIRKAFEVQMAGLGFSMVEVLSHVLLTGVKLL